VAGALMVIVVLHLRRRGANLRVISSTLAPLALISALPLLPWLWRNWRCTGNPIFPMFSSLIPTRDWSARHAQVFGKFFKLYNWGLDLPIDESQRKWVLLLVAVSVLVVLGLAIALSRQVLRRDLLIFAWLLLLAAFSVTGLYARFLLPPIICILVVLGSWCADRWPARDMLMRLATLVLVVAVAKWGSWARGDFMTSFKIAVGMEQERLDDQFGNAWRYVNDHTPENAHVLMAGFCPSFGRTSGMAFWVDRSTYTTDGHLQDFIRLDDWPTFMASIRRAHIDFVVIAETAPQSRLPVCSSVSFYPEGKREYPFNRRLVDEYGTRVHRSGDLAVYRLGQLEQTSNIHAAM
jgi:hypothetical protein